MKLKNKKLIQVLLGLIIVFFILLINREISFEKLLEIKLNYLLLLFFVYYLMILIVSLRWGMIVNFLEKRKVMSYRKYLFYYSLSNLISSFTFQELTNFGARATSLIAEKISLNKITNSYVIEKFLNFLNLLSLIIISLLYYLKIIDANLSLLGIILISIIFYFLISSQLFNFTKFVFFFNKLLTKIIKIIPGIKKKINFDLLEKEIHDIILSKPQIRKLYLISILKYLLFNLFVFFVFKSFDIGINLINVLLATPIVDLSTIFAFTPGGLGIFEAGWYIILKIIGVAAIDISTFIIGYRLISYFIISITAIINYFLFLTIKKLPR